jgi:fucose 4-O-acetylase-like acetyltransferase
VGGIRELAGRTPAHRDRYLDLLRAVAIGAVVIGHWLITVVESDPAGRLTGTSALGELAWSHPVSWLFQVMPLFFMVGGYANAASLEAHRRHGGDAAGWLLDRSTRLVRPTTVLLVVIAAVAVLAWWLGGDPELIGTAAWLVSLPLWFLIAYLGVVALTPVMLAAHRRFGLAVPVLLLLPVVVGDLLRFRYDSEAFAVGNYAFAWLAIHQVGFAWRDGRLPARPRTALPLLLIGLGGLLAFTLAGPYPVSMVTVPGAAMQNSSPPSLALVALATAQLGLALLLRGPATRWLQRPRPWTAVVAVNAVILTVFLWHMAAVVLVTLVLDRLGALPTVPVDDPTWLLWRIPWLAVLAVALAGLVALFARFERPGRPRERRELPGRAPIVVAVVGGYAAVIGGLLWQALAGSGYRGPFGVPTGALLLFLAGAATLWLARRTSTAVATTAAATPSPR